MATCTNCSSGTITFPSGAVNTFPSSQFGNFFTSYPTTCPGGCLYLTSSGYRCSTATSSFNCGCNRGCNCGCKGCAGCSTCPGSGIMPF